MDPISRQNIRNNWDLSALRASPVVQALQNNYGVGPKRLTAEGRVIYYKHHIISLRYQLAKSGIEVIEIVPPMVNTNSGGTGLHANTVSPEEFTEDLFILPAFIPSCFRAFVPFPITFMYFCTNENSKREKF